MKTQTVSGRGAANADSTGKVIAGVLNVLVIYDAAAGPAFGAVEDTRRPQKEASAA